MAKGMNDVPKSAGSEITMTTNPIVAIAAQGDHYDIGHALGVASGRAVREHVFVTTEFQELTARWRGSTRLKQLEAAARGAFPTIVRELEGMAAGAVLDFETLFLWNCRGDLRLPPDGAEAEGCTCVLHPGDRAGTPGVIAHNEDGAPEFLGHCYWVRVEPTTGPHFESFMYPGMLPGHTFGANDRGLVQTINNIRVHDLHPGVPRQVITRAILSCDDLDSALTLLRRRDRASGFHHALGDARNGRIVSVEAPASGCHVEPADRPIGHANHLVYPMFHGAAQEITRSSSDRQRFVDQSGVDPKDPEAVLFDRTVPVYRASDRGDDYSQTLATGVFHLSADRVAWTVHASPDETGTLNGAFNLS